MRVEKRTEMSGGDREEGGTARTDIRWSENNDLETSRTIKQSEHVKGKRKNVLSAVRGRKELPGGRGGLEPVPQNT